MDQSNQSLNEQGWQVDFTWRNQLGKILISNWYLHNIDLANTFLWFFDLYTCRKESSISRNWVFIIWFTICVYGFKSDNYL